MSIQSIGNPSTVAATTSGGDSPWSSVRQNFRGLESSLLNGDLTGAQGAFASLQQALGAVPSSSNSGSTLAQLGQTSSPLGQDMQAVSAALGANDLGAAQKAFAKLQQDMQAAFQANGASGAHHGHHGYHAKCDDSANASTGTSTSSTSATGSVVNTTA
jgi:hypothetical protein